MWAKQNCALRSPAQAGIRGSAVKGGQAWWVQEEVEYKERSGQAPPTLQGWELIFWACNIAQARQPGETPRPWPLAGGVGARHRA